MSISFNGNTLVPTPLVNLQKSYTRNQQNAIIGVDYVFTLTGTIVNADTSLDSPGASGALTMEGVQAGQAYIRGIFNAPSGYGLLQIQSPQMTTSGLLTYAIVESIDFEKGTWVNRDDYSITLRSKGIEGSNDPFGRLTEMNESWSVRENEDQTYNVDHQISARGIQIYQGGTPNNPLSDAKAWVASKSYTTTTGGVLTTGTSGDMDLSQLIYPLPVSANYWNRGQVETVDPYTFSYSLTETFIYNPSGSIREEYNANVSYDSNPSRATISIQGEVIGYADDIKNFTLKYSNAKNQFDTIVAPNLYTRAANFAPSGFTVNTYNTSRQVNLEPFKGTVRYSANFLAVQGGSLIPNAVEESIDISDTGNNDVFAQIPVPGRAKGPIIQYMGTKTIPERTISISAVIAGGSGTGIAGLKSLYLSKPNTDSIIEQFTPSSGVYLLKQNSENWNPIRRQYGRVVSWIIDNSYSSGSYDGKPTYISSASGTLPSGAYVP